MAAFDPRGSSARKRHRCHERGKRPGVLCGSFPHMIDISQETLVTLTEAARSLPGRSGRRLHVSTLYRWATRGIRGFTLETIQVGGTKCTSGEALQRFFEMLTAHQRSRGCRAKKLRDVEAGRS